MPKITRTGGASFTDENGEPVRGPEGLQVIPTEGEPASHYDGPQTDENGEPVQVADTAAYSSERQDTPAAPVLDDDADRPQDYVTDPGQLDTQGGDGSATQFDPSAHTVAEVQDYLNGCNDASERERVLNAEAAGKNRTTIMNSRAADAATNPDESTEE